MDVDKGMAVLVVDEYNTTRSIISRLLQQLGFYNIEESAGTDEAFKALCEKSFGLVVYDANQQPERGIALLARLQAHPALQALPFLLITEETSPAQIAASKQAGADGYMVKPIQAEALKAKLVSILGPF